MSVIKTKYNEVKFTGYPFSIDGLSGSKVNRLSYVIDEHLTFLTDSVSIISKRDSIFHEEAFSGFLSIDFDEETVELFKVEKNH